MIANHFQVLANDGRLETVTKLKLRQSNKELTLKINSILKEYFKLLDDTLNEGIKTKNLMQI